MNRNDTREVGQFIPLHYHYQMLYDSDRIGGFRSAINHVVKPGAVALELGSGTGVLSFFAAEKARKVYSVEYNLDLVDISRSLLAKNKNGERVEVIHADAFEYVPPEPVDVVICEMLHVGLLREKQLAIIDAFKSRYQSSFKDQPLPVFVPEAVIQAVQPLQHDFSFEGYYAPITLFQHPYATDPRTKELGDPVIYHQLLYGHNFGLECKWNGTVPITTDGKLNALRIITKNILAINHEENSTFDWFNQLLVIALDETLDLKAGQNISVSIDYNAGDPLTALKPVVELL